MKRRALSEFGKFVNEKLIELNMTQKELANEIGTSPVYLSYILRGEIGVEKIFIEKISGNNVNRPELQRMLEYIREEDIVYIESISRLGRSLKDLLDIVDTSNNKGVGLVSLKENHIDTTTPQGKLIFNIFATLSEFERESLKQKQREGIIIGKANGVYIRKKKD